MEEKILIQKFKDNYSQEQFDKIVTAFEFAKIAHLGQKRQSGEEYINHPMVVSDILVEFGLDYETIIAALLHDVVEDTPVTADEVNKKFGSGVARLVAGVTKLNKVQFKSREDEQAENLRKMLIAMTDDIRVIIIKLADRLHNMRTLHFKVSDKQISTAKETLEIYAPIAARLGMGTIKGELEDLSMRYLMPEEYYSLVDRVASKRLERETFVEKVVKEIEKKLKEMDIVGEVNGRPKHFYSIFKKMQAGKTFEQIYDLIAVRIIVDSIKDCYAVLGAIHTMWKPLPGRFKDYIAMPKPNKYQSLHTTVLTNFGSPFEIQIRTHEMHQIAEYGIAAHWKYKEGNDTAKQTVMDDRIKWLRSMMETQTDSKDNAEFLSSLKIDLYIDEVFVLTPKGDVINLPQGATGIDFAYAVHSAVGNKCVGIKIDGKIVPINTQLTNNTIVEAITSNNSKGPSRDWLKFAVSSSAKSKIKAYFKKEMREENIKRGHEMLEREARHRGYNLNELITSEKWITYIDTRYSLHSAEDVYAEVGYGAFTTNKVILKLIDFFKRDISESKPIIEIKEAKPSSNKKSGSGVLIKGYDDFLIRLSHCCSPVPGDRIIGYISRGRGVSIHRADCPNMKNVEAERIIEACWPNSTNQKFLALFEIIGLNRTSLLLDITKMIAECRLTIIRVNARVEKNEKAIISLGVEIDNISALDSIIEKLKKIDGVSEVYRQ